MNMLALGKDRGNPYTSGRVPENFSIPKSTPSSWNRTSVPEAASLTTAEPAGPLNPKAEEQKLIDEKFDAYRKMKKLEELLAKNKAKIAELERNKRGSVQRDPELIETHKLSKDIERRRDEYKTQLEVIQNKLNKLKGLPSVTEKNDEPSSSTNSIPHPSSFSTAMRNDDNDDVEDSKFEYFDEGNHVCKVCDELFPKLNDYLDHFLGDKHWKRVDKNAQPWKIGEREQKRYTGYEPTLMPIKGTEFMSAIKGYHCGVCNVFAGNKEHAEEHLKSARHNRAFARYTLMNPDYERKWESDRRELLDKLDQEVKRKEREREEKIAAKKAKELREREREKEREKAKEKEKEKETEKERNKRVIERTRDDSSSSEDERKERKPAFMKKDKMEKIVKRARISSSRSRSPSPSISKKSVSEDEPVLIDWRTDEKCNQDCIVVISNQDMKRAYGAMMQQGYELKSTETISSSPSDAQDLFKVPSFSFLSDPSGGIKQEVDDTEFDASNLIASLEPSEDSSSRLTQPAQQITKECRTISERSSVSLVIDTSFSSEMSGKPEPPSDPGLRYQPSQPPASSDPIIDISRRIIDDPDKKQNDDSDSDRETVPGNECPAERLKQLDGLIPETDPKNTLADKRDEEPPELPPILDLNDLSDPLERSPPYSRD